ncbi:hypothetical protein HHI36_015138 [Cryptolaemus montrouzieri]|uniref:Uncharacterized protein n=1 Tax=Cryptolaemus montrouzieri TaxID=559131 RepID=A0ABD2N4S1_9CUCU
MITESVQGKLKGKYANHDQSLLRIELNLTLLRVDGPNYCDLNLSDRTNHNSEVLDYGHISQMFQFDSVISCCIHRNLGNPIDSGDDEKFFLLENFKRIYVNFSPSFENRCFPTYASRSYSPETKKL